MERKNFQEIQHADCMKELKLQVELFSGDF